MLIEVFEAEKSRIRWYYLIAYGLPLVIVAVTGSIFPHEYGTDRYCWLRADNYIIYSFVGPVIVVILVRKEIYYFYYDENCNAFSLTAEFNFLNDGNLHDVQARKHLGVYEE